MEIKVEFSKLGSLVLKEPVTLELKHTILYGRSGVGKSLIMKATMVGLTIYEDIRLFLLPGLYGLKRLLKASDFKVAVCGDPQRIARITAGTARIVTEVDDERRMYKISVGDQSDLQRMLSDPRFAKKINDVFDLWHTNIEVYGGFFREYGGEWVRVVNLPYSYRRIIAILYALEKSDIVFIEAFDAGLHMSTMKRLIDYISEDYKDKVVVAELHHTPGIVFGLQRGWKAYVIEKERVTKLERYEDIKNTDAFFRELSEVSSF
jgi:hypothetical protein